jgi:hypothetical protein
MGKDEVMALEGRELDAAVAERIFGWQWLMHPHLNRAEIFSPQAVTYLRGPHYGWLPDDGSKERMRPYEAPAYSSTWNGIGLVEEAMAQRGYYLTLKSPFEPGQPYFAGFTPHGTTGWNGRPDHEAPGATAPLAVARAALLTLLSEAAP